MRRLMKASSGMSNKNTKSQLPALSGSAKCAKDFASWMVFYPDLFLDLCKPPNGGITLTFDQRVFLRCAARFVSVYGCFPRGWGKTWGEFAIMLITAIRYPGIRLAISAQTLENAAQISKDKYKDLTTQYPILKNEEDELRSSKNTFELVLKNGSEITILGNSQSSKGRRAHRLNIEESVLMNDALFKDVLQPVVSAPRRTYGHLAVVNPEELNHKIDFFSTTGFRGSTEHQRCLDMLRNMIDLKGQIVIGADWLLTCWYGRNMTKSQMLSLRETDSPTSFGQNYEENWIGTSDGALVDIKKLINCRTLCRPEVDESSIDKEGEYYLGVDVARSYNKSNNQSSIIVVRVDRVASSGKIRQISVVNIIHVPNTATFSTLSMIVKLTKWLYKARAVVVDGNGLGQGLMDELVKDTVDKSNGESIGCLDTINTPRIPEVAGAEKCVYELKSQGLENAITVNFINMVESGILRLLEHRQTQSFTGVSEQNVDKHILPYVQTDLLFGEISNLKIKHNQTGGLTVERVVRKIDKDRYSALAYVLWYISEFRNTIKASNNQDLASIMSLARGSSIYNKSNKQKGALLVL